jgi:hypothetical protein
MGLLLVTLGCVSYTVDVARGDTVQPRNPLELVGYLLFFPTLLIGPVIPSKQYFEKTDSLCFDPAGFSRGVRLYMMGYVKRLAIAAVLMRALGQILQFTNYAACSILILLALLALSFFLFYFFICGTADMASGVCAMYGIQAPTAYRDPLSANTPDRFLLSCMLWLRNYLIDYLICPLQRITRGKLGRRTSSLLIVCLTVLALRTRVELLLFAAPILLTCMLWGTKPVNRMLRCRPPLCYLLRTVSVLLVSVFTLAMCLQRPLDVVDLIVQTFAGDHSYLPYHVFSITQDEVYLLFASIVLLLLFLYSRIRKRMLAKRRGQLPTALLWTETVLLFVAFILSLTYFLPQFPLQI